MQISKEPQAFHHRSV